MSRRNPLRRLRPFLGLLLASIYCTVLSADMWPGTTWQRASPEQVGLDAGLLSEAREYALTAGGAGYITRHGKLVMAWGDAEQKYDLKSTSKSISVTALGLALADKKLQLNDPARKHHPSLGLPPASNRETGWLDEITVLHLATQTAGFAKPGGYESLLFRPGTEWHYSDGGPNWLAECITLLYRQDLETLLFQRVFSELGITRDDLHWRQHAYRPPQLNGFPRREFGSGVHANVDAMARIGYLYLRRGKWRDRQLIPADFVDRVRTTVPAVVGLPEHPSEATDGSGRKTWAHGNASDHYGLLWWNNADETLHDVPRDAYWSWGLYDSLILVIPSLDMVVTRTGKSWPRESDDRHYDVLRPFFVPLVRAAHQDVDPSTDVGSRPPYPPSEVITGIQWAGAETIVREAPGSDNWPVTWADDGDLYAAYGDGWGFRPLVEKKLSLGLARISGGPDDWHGSNLRSSSIEQLGQGAHGKKASGLLMVDHVLYMWVRNAQNSQLAWSADHGQTWQRADWRFTTSFGCPTFLNFGKNYDGARDRFVYTYSLDSDTAYDAADRMVLARVPQDRIRVREAYEFFEHIDKNGEPRWTKDISERGAVFEHPGRCYRAGVTYNAGLHRYLYCQVLPGSKDPRGPRFQGGFGIYDAATPWGPWTTVFFTENWDVGPGDTNCIPAKWISSDGRQIHLVFAGDDHFSVRRATLQTLATSPQATR